LFKNKECADYVNYWTASVGLLLFHYTTVYCLLILWITGLLLLDYCSSTSLLLLLTIYAGLPLCTTVRLLLKSAAVIVPLIYSCWSTLALKNCKLKYNHGT